jgi:hypothetical protein
VATWTGWEAEFLTAAQVPNTAENRLFLDEWAAHAETNCRNNPIDLSAQTAGASNCHALPAVTARAQNYTTHGNAAHAFFVETHRASSTALINALESGDPFTVNNTGSVAANLTAWGSQTFAQFYFNQTAGQRGGGVGNTTDALKGWKHMRKSFNHHMPDALNYSERQGVRALHSLARARKVKF